MKKIDINSHLRRKNLERDRFLSVANCKDILLQILDFKQIDPD